MELHEPQSATEQTGSETSYVVTNLHIPLFRRRRLENFPVSLFGQRHTDEQKTSTSPFLPSRFPRDFQIRNLHPPDRSIRIREQRIFIFILVFFLGGLLLLSLFLESFPIGAAQLWLLKGGSWSSLFFGFFFLFLLLFLLLIIVVVIVVFFITLPIAVASQT